MLGFVSCRRYSKKNHKEVISRQVYLNYLDSIKGKGCISGQFIRWNYNASLQEIKAIHNISGQWVGMLGGDYYGNFMDSIPSPKCEYKLTNKVIISYYKKNGLVNLSLHFINPQNQGSAWNKEIDFDSLLVKNSRIQNNYLIELDTVAVGVKKLQKSGVMVMLRPFHEMNGGWFWWGRQERYKELWIMTHKYMTNIKGLDNILWCWSPDANAGEFHQYYPGDEYVDLVGLDAYSSNLPGCCTKPFQEILKYGKPFGISEYGCVGGGEKKAGPFDYGLFLHWLKENFPQTVYFLTWRDHWGMAGQEGVDLLMNDSRILNKDIIENLGTKEF